MLPTNIYEPALHSVAHHFLDVRLGGLVVRKQTKLVLAVRHLIVDSETVLVDWFAGLGVVAHRGNPCMGHPWWGPEFCFL